MELANLKFMTSSEVAEILKMHPQVINRKLQAGELEGYKIGKEWRVSEAQLFKFLEANSNQRPKPTKQSRTLAAFFDKDGRLKAIPTTRSKRLFVLQHLAGKLDPARVYSEDEINKFIAPFHEDVCTIRREFIMNKLMVRKSGKYKVVSWNR
jgi:excisionase family DNA binding protein